MTGRQIQKLRHALGESTETFGARFARSERTIENWEQDRTAVEPLALKMLQALWDETFPKPRRKKK